MPGPTRKGIFNDCLLSNEIHIGGGGVKASRFIIILNRKVGQNHQVGAMEVKPRWKQKSLGMVFRSEMACWTVTFTCKLFYWDKHKIKLESLTLRQGIRNLLISKQKSRKTHGLWRSSTDNHTPIFHRQRRPRQKMVRNRCQNRVHVGHFLNCSPASSVWFSL